MTAAIHKTIIIVLEALNEDVEDAFHFNHVNTSVEMTENSVLQVKDNKAMLMQIFQIFFSFICYFSLIFRKSNKFSFLKLNVTVTPLQRTTI